MRTTINHTDIKNLQWAALDPADRLWVVVHPGGLFGLGTKRTEPKRRTDAEQLMNELARQYGAERVWLEEAQ